MASRPGRVIAEIAIDAPYPRTEEFRMSPLFNDYCRQISYALSQASLGAQAASQAATPTDPPTALNRFNSVFR